MSTNGQTSGLGTIGWANPRHVRRALVWLAALVAAVTIAAAAAFVIHRATSPDSTVAPTTGTQQQAAPYERAADPSRRLIEINDQPAAGPANAAPAAPQGHPRTLQPS